ncbi:MAG: cell division protein ZapA [Firmicutes bacterium]|nr:cell division protein ZapA [Bacillota bacterium]
MSKNKVTVTIAGKGYTILSSETEEYVQKIADHLDKKISEVAYSNSQFTVQMSTILAAINVTDEYFKSLNAADNLRQQIGQYIDDVSKERAELTSLRAENARLKQQLKNCANNNASAPDQQSIL